MRTRPDFPSLVWLSLGVLGGVAWVGGCGADGPGASAGADAAGPAGGAPAKTDAGGGAPVMAGPGAYTLLEAPADWPLFTGPPGHTPRAADAPPAERASGLVVRAARGESEPVWLALPPGPRSVRVAVEGLPAGGPRVTAYAAGFTDGAADALVPLAPGAAATRSDDASNLALVLDVAVPRESAAGEVEAALVLTPDAGEAVRVPLRVHVFDFALPEEIHFKSQINLDPRALIPPGGDVSDARDLLFALHLTPANPLWPSGFRWDITWDNPASPARCAALYDEADAPPEYAVGALAAERLLGEGWNGAGFPDAELFQFVDNATPRPDTFCGEARGDAFGTAAYNAAWGRWLSALRDYLSARGLLSRTYGYLMNEPQTPSDARLAAHLCRLVRAAAPGLRIAISEEPTPAIAEDADGPCGYDVWIASLPHLNRAYAEVRQRDFGEEVWLYSLDHDPPPYPNPTSPAAEALDARILPWISWALRVRGWAYYDGGRFFAGAAPTYRALALRDGFEDYEYLYLANGAEVPAAGAAARADDTVAAVASDLTQYTRDAARLSVLRDALGAYLGGERPALPTSVEAPGPAAPRSVRAVNFQDPAGPPAAEPLVVDGRTFEKVGLTAWDEARGLGFTGEHVGDPSIARAGYDEVEGFSELERSYVFDDYGRPYVFELALAPGRYRVELGLGRPAHGYPGDPVNVTVEGLPVAVDEITTDETPTLRRTQLVDVRDGRLTVTFGGRSALTGEYAYTFAAWLVAEPVE